MPLYYFILKSDRDNYADEQGEELADLGAARRYAETVARELMQGREPETRFWRVEVCDDYAEPLFEVLFAEVDRTIDHLPVPWRDAIHNTCLRMGRLTDAISRVKTTISEVQNTLNEANRLLNASRRSL
jgi:hypothetical protein